MTAAAEPKIKEVDLSIRQALEDALARGALPGESEGFDEAALANAAAFLASTASHRYPGQPAIAIETLGESVSGRFMRIALVNDDMPFLVDSIAHTLAAQDITIHRLLHPVLSVSRDANGALKAILDDEMSGARRESMIYIEADRADAKVRRALEKDLRDTLADVRAAVADWPRMQEAMAADADAIPDEEGAALLRWFLSRHFTQTGHEVCGRDGKARDGIGICALRDKPLIAPASREAAFAWFEEGKRVPLIIKSNIASRVHRHVLLDLIIVPVRQGKDVVALSIHAGMWTSSALAAPPDKVPLLRSALSLLMEKFGFDPVGHAGKTLVHALTALPHDILIGFDRETLERLALTFMSLADRPRPKLALATSALARHLYAFVWLPRDELSTARRVSIQDMLSQAANGAAVLSWSIALEEGGLALLRITLDLRDGGVVPDDAELDERLRKMVRGWLPAVEESLAETEEPGRAAALAQRFASGFPMAYRNGAGPAEAAIDIRLIHGLSGPGDKSIRIYRNPEDSAERLRLKLYSHDAIALSEVVPAFENFGFRVIDEMTTAIDGGALGHVQRFVLELPAGGDAEAVIARADVVTEAVAQVIEGVAEDDRLNELIVTAGLSPRAVVLFRALFSYLRQTGMAYSRATVADTLRREKDVAHRLVELFTALHDPAAKDGEARAAKAQAAIEEGLEKVTAIDEDRVLRLLRAVITATLRTNFFAPASTEALAFKLDSAQVPGLPAPLPWREIWVYSPRVEGIHLRAGPVARGGLRWSDRRDDFRTEVLGLMKAQRVK
ncbi:MAG: NAD-glutamate dehydrogenase, partial [Sphingobium sp.]